MVERNYTIQVAFQLTLQRTGQRNPSTSQEIEFVFTIIDTEILL